MPGPTADSHDGRVETAESETEARAKLGKYEIVDKIGDGGFGVVYQGYDPFIKRYIALKTCTSPDEEVRQRFFREAEISGRLDHPNIVRVLDFGIQDETPFLVQEFLQGQDLSQKIRGREFLPYSEQLLILIQIARGLEYAHSMGVIHRDVKPSNVQILDDGTAKIMDFGIAILDQMESRVTREGMAVGTAAYLAPEQIRGEPPDPRTDIFSYGVLAYELVTAERPFGKETISATFYEILHDDPVPISAAQCPEALRAVIHRCLRKEADERYQSFREILQELNQVRDQLQKRRPSSSLSQSLRRAAYDPSLEATKVRPTSVPPVARKPPVSEVKYEPPITSEWAASGQTRRRRTSKAPLLLLILLLLAGGGSYWWLLQQGIAPPVRQVAETIKLGAVSLINDLFSSVGLSSPLEHSAADVGAAPTVTEPEPASEPAPVDVVEESSAEEAAAPAAAPEALVPFQREEPTPTRANLVIDQSWHQAMTVSLDGGPPLALTTARNLEVEPGKHVLMFALRTPRYRTTETVDVALEAGEKITVKSPISPPGALSVQANLGSPQGVVAINGSVIGATPFQGRLLKPGTYRMTIRPAGDPGAAAIEASLTVQSGRETVVTFDITGQRGLEIRRRPIER